MPIGVFDSGIGGISVMKEMIRLMPTEDFIYYGDSKHAPYGTKTLEEVREYSFHIAEFLLSKGVKALVVACNTATSAAVKLMREKYPELPIVGIEPAIKPAVEGYKGGQIIVMATPMTIREEKFQRLMNQYAGKAEIVPVPFPGLMEYVEQGVLEGEQLNHYLKSMLEPYLDKKVSSIVLGCTHYPFIVKELKKVVGDQIDIYDGSLGTAREIKRRMSEKNLITDSKKPGSVEMINSAGSIDFIELSFRLLDEE